MNKLDVKKIKVPKLPKSSENKTGRKPGYKFDYKSFLAKSNLKIDRDYVESMFTPPDKITNLFNNYYSIYSGYMTYFCEIHSLYNTILDDTIANIKTSSDVLSEDDQKTITKLVKEIFCVQVIIPFVKNIKILENNVKSIKRNIYDQNNELKNQLLRSITKLLFDIEEFELFMEAKEFGPIEMDIEIAGDE